MIVPRGLCAVQPTLQRIDKGRYKYLPLAIDDLSIGRRLDVLGSFDDLSIAYQQVGIFELAIRTDNDVRMRQQHAGCRPRLYTSVGAVLVCA